MTSPILRLAHKQLELEGKLNFKDRISLSLYMVTNEYQSLLWDRADKIVGYLDIVERNKKVAENRHKKIKKVITITK